MIRKKKLEEVDSILEKLSLGGSALIEIGTYPFSERYGWLKDKFGFSWQIVPTNIDEMLSSSDKEKTSRVTKAFLEMKKIDLAVLNQAAEDK